MTTRKSKKNGGWEVRTSKVVEYRWTCSCGSSKFHLIKVVNNEQCASESKIECYYCEQQSATSIDPEERP